MTPNCDQLSGAQALVPYTGYYTIDGGSGAFVMVDPYMTVASAPGKAPVNTYLAKITVSTDGLNSTVYQVGIDCSFDGKTLLIPDGVGVPIANLSFDNSASPTKLSGKLGTTPVAGSSPFGTVLLSQWSGTYYAQGPRFMVRDQMVYPYLPALQVNPDGTILYAAGGAPLTLVTNYWYDYGMFVIGLEIDPKKPILWEMGTSSGWGRVAGNASDGQMLVNLQLQEPAPHL